MNVNSAEKDVQLGDEDIIYALSSEIYSRRLYFAFGILPFTVCVVATAICIIYNVVVSSSPSFMIIVALFWWVLFKAIHFYAPSASHLSRALHQTCYNPSFMVKFCLVVKMALYWMLPSSTTATTRSNTVIISTLLLFTFHFIMAISCISIAAYFRFKAGPFALLNCSPTPLLQPVDHRSTSIMAEFWSFLLDITSSDTPSSSSSSAEISTANKSATNSGVPSTSIARTVTLTSTADAIIPDTNDPHQSQQIHINARIYNNNSRLFIKLFVQLFSHAALGAFFGAYLLFAFLAPLGHVGMLDIFNNVSTDMPNGISFSVILSGVVSFMVFFDMSMPKPKVNLDIRRYLKFVYDDNVDSASTVKAIIGIIKSIWDESKVIVYASIRRLIFIGCLLVGIILSFLLLSTTRHPLIFSTSMMAEEVTTMNTSYLLLLQLAFSQTIYIFKLIFACTGVYLIGLCGSVFVDTLGRLVLSQPISIRSLCKEYKRILVQRPQNSLNGAVSPAAYSHTQGDVNSRTVLLPVQTRLFLEYTMLLFSDGITAKSYRQKMMDFLVGTTSTEQQRNRPFVSFGLDPGALEVHRTENAMHLLVESWTIKIGEHKSSLATDLCRALLIETLGGGDEVSLFPSNCDDSSYPIISSRHGISIESCLLLQDSGIIISRCMIALAGAYGILLFELSSSKDMLFLCPVAVSHAEMCVRAAARMILVATQSSHQYSRQSLMIPALLRAAYKLHLGASCYGKHENNLFRKSSVHDSITTTPQTQQQQQRKASKASYIIHQVAGNGSNMQFIRRQLCAYEIDQMKGDNFSSIFVYRLLVAADEAVVLLASSGIFSTSNNDGQEIQGRRFIEAGSVFNGLDRGCQAWINEVLLVASSVTCI